MKPKIAISLFVIFFLALNTLAQKEAAVWPVGAGKQFNFRSGDFELSDFNGNSDVNSTICDKDGNLLLYTNGNTVWNAKNEILINGTGLLENNEINIPGSTPVFIPYPQKEGWYILIFEAVPRNGYNLRDTKLYYVEININTYNGQGEVATQRIMIHDNYHFGPTIAGFCDNSYYWLVIDRNDNVIIDSHRDRIYLYKIDKYGVNLTPEINEDLDMGASGGYKFSPNGNKIYFGYGENGSLNYYETIVDFNFTKGELYNFRHLGSEINFSKEFSPDSRLLYFFSGSSLVQMDVGYTSSTLIKNSAKVILTLNTTENDKYPGFGLQLAPDRKIYFYYNDVNTGDRKIGRINKPNNRGDACNIETDFLTITDVNFRLPEFVTSFFRDKHPEITDIVIADAGNDIELCANSGAIIGVAGSDNAFYHWFPDVGLADPFSSETVYTPNLQLHESPRTSPITLRVTDGNCWMNFDMAKITVLPYPRDLPLDGSWSVCPFVKEVDYWTVDDKNDLHWSVDGGEIVSNPKKDSIKINWWETNPNASVSIFSTNNYGCISDTSVFPVRINVELITETPKGPDKICIANAKNVAYKIQNTNGSFYDWIPENGKVVFGQGTNDVLVSWEKAGINRMSVKETSLTSDTICYGESEPLFVEVVNDSLEIELTNVSYNLENNIEVLYNSEKLNRDNHTLFQIVENEWGEVQKENQVNYSYNGIFVYDEKTTGLTSQIFRLKIVNSCNENFYSNQQQTVVVHGGEVENTVQLTWNMNQFWESDKLKHEIWYSANGIDGWKLLSELEEETGFQMNKTGLSLINYFRVKEYNFDKNVESWSNIVKIEIDDEVKIPDVFTPNNDGFNDVWEIQNLNFHSFKGAFVYNKLGKIVYECEDVFIPWDGKINNTIYQGTYFYQITYDSNKIKYGQVTILQ